MKIPAGLSRSSRVLLLAVPLVLSACSAPETLLREKQITHGNREKVEAGVFDQAIEAEEPDAVSDPKEVWRARRKRLLAMEQWAVFGKLALRSSTEAWTATLYWRQQGDDYRIRLIGPFGGGGLEIAGDLNTVELRTADNQVHTARDPEELLYQHVGWRVPLSGLRYWILGRVEPEVPVEQVFIDVAGRVVRFDQSGWNVQYLDYRDIDEFAMPRKAALENDQVTASVLVSRWEIEDQESEAQ